MFSGFLQDQFTPLALGSCILWLRSDLGIPNCADGQKFTTWNDQSASGLVFSQATAANQFVWNASDASFGGQPSVTSVAAAYMASTANAPATSQPFTIYTVQNTTSLVTEQVIFFSK